MLKVQTKTGGAGYYTGRVSVEYKQITDTVVFVEIIRGEGVDKEVIASYNADEVVSMVESEVAKDDS